MNLGASVHLVPIFKITGNRNNGKFYSKQD